MGIGYFDHNATTPLCPEAKAAWLHAQENLWLNPSSPYRRSAQVHAHLESARERLAELFEVVPARIVFNSGATEGNNAVFAHWASTLPKNGHVGVGSTEHPSVLEAAEYYLGDRVHWLAVDGSGAVDIARIDFDSLAAISVMAANNETGVLNPWQEVALAAKRAGVAYHCDASQWIGKLSMKGLSNCDFVTGCAHKFGGPQGVGFLLIPEAGADFCSFVGGTQEGGHRAGTEDVPSILSMLVALEEISGAKPGDPKGRNCFEEAVEDFCQVISQEGERLWNTSLLLLPEIASERWVRALEKRGFLVSTGAACATGKATDSHVLTAMGMEADSLRRVLRVSSGRDTMLTDWLALAAALRAAYEELQSDRPNNITIIHS
ncbi:MAG: cysteine desulfurase family protein [Coraliomargaritaceae bacterium]